MGEILQETWGQEELNLLKHFVYTQCHAILSASIQKLSPRLLTVLEIGLAVAKQLLGKLIVLSCDSAFLCQITELSWSSAWGALLVKSHFCFTGSEPGKNTDDQLVKNNCDAVFGFGSFSVHAVAIY